MLLEHQERTHQYEALNAKSCTLESELHTAFLRILELKQHREGLQGLVDQYRRVCKEHEERLKELDKEKALQDQVLEENLQKLAETFERLAKQIMFKLKNFCTRYGDETLEIQSQLEMLISQETIFERCIRGTQGFIALSHERSTSFPDEWRQQQHINHIIILIYYVHFSIYVIYAL